MRSFNLVSASNVLVLFQNKGSRRSLSDRVFKSVPKWGMSKTSKRTYRVRRKKSCALVWASQYIIFISSLFFEILLQKCFQLFQNVLLFFL